MRAAFAFLVCLMLLPAYAQTEENKLDIPHKRIESADYRAGNELHVQQGQLDVKAGVSVWAEKLQAVLEGVRGTVIFRAPATWNPWRGRTTPTKSTEVR